MNEPTIITLTRAHELMQAGDHYTVHHMLEIAGQQFATAVCTLTFDENGQDYLTVAATIPGRLPASIDARTAPPGQLTTWISFPDPNEETSPTSLTLVLRDDEHQRQSGVDETHVILQSQESLIRDDAARTTRTFTASSKLVGAITEIIRSVLPSAVITASVASTATFLTGEDTIDWEPTKNPWAIITEICDSASVGESECLNDGTRFLIRKKLALASPTYTFTEPANIAARTLTRSRDEFYNAAMIERSNGVVTLVEDNRPIYGVNAAGRRLTQINTGIRGSAAANYAQAVINRGINSGLALTLSTPDCPLGLRPGATVSVFINEEMTDWLISSIQFDLTTGNSALTLRKDA